ncbi:unnamed protein product [Effrenium voratum]|uniref:RRM domain-containing protein n=1 Tax=Effrenium voratum TaxID=2562239 RepID=A0AA36I206_9DINO|nr:unnamed protein product [Effrenium voratum]CAJ1419516.1 unnamed protein product [Effrenium voratum]
MAYITMPPVSHASVPLPSSKFWASEQTIESWDLKEPVKVNLDLRQLDQGLSSCWMDEYGLHPSSCFWQGVTKMMIRNVPARCQQEEVDRLIQVITPNFETRMPRSSSCKCKGYAFVEVDSPATMQLLAYFLWQARVPTRQSNRPLKIHPANLEVKSMSL